MKRIFDIKIIGLGLAVLYAVSFLLFFGVFKTDNIQINSAIYIFLFFCMFIGAIAVIRLQEWGRKLIVAVNAVMFLCLMAKYIPQVDLVPLAYLAMNIIVFLYFSQSNVKKYFHGVKQKDAWQSILLIDDDEMHIKTVRPILIKNGYSVLTAMTGEDGFQIARTQKPDLVLLDVILPGLKGRDVCKKLKENEETKDIPVVFFTAKDSPEDIQAEKEVGGIGHITKPMRPKELVESVKKYLAGK